MGKYNVTVQKICGVRLILLFHSSNSPINVRTEQSSFVPRDAGFICTTLYYLDDINVILCHELADF